MQFNREYSRFFGGHPPETSVPGASPAQGIPSP